VLALGTSPTEYAAQLLGIARSARAVGVRGSVSVAMARRSQLEQRLTAILVERKMLASLDAQFHRRSFGRGTTVTGMLAATIIVPLAMLQPIAQELPKPGATSIPAPATVDSATTIPSYAASAPCDSSALDGSSLHVEASESDTVTVSWTDGQCNGTVRVEGPFTLTATAKMWPSFRPAASS
jgi:hypothetical protein